jgi:hypothetical protein
MQPVRSQNWQLCFCPIRFNERMDLDTLPTAGTTPRRTQYAPRFDGREKFSTFRPEKEGFGAPPVPGLGGMGA